MSDCPITTSAAWPLIVGNVFQRRTRWLTPGSTTINLSPSDHVAIGALMVFAASLPPPFKLLDVKFACPSTKSADAPLVVGTLFQIRTRFRLVSEIIILPLGSTKTPLIATELPNCD